MVLSLIWPRGICYDAPRRRVSFYPARRSTGRQLTDAHVADYIQLSILGNIIDGLKPLIIKSEYVSTVVEEAPTKPF